MGSNPGYLLKSYLLYQAESLLWLCTMKTSKFASEINWPLEFTAILYMIILVAITSQIENVNKQGANSIKVFALQIGVNFKTKFLYGKMVKTKTAFQKMHRI